jgi:carbamoyl-phosphate synthase small subunit
VKDLETGRVEVTSHNHGFAVDPAGFSGGGSSLSHEAIQGDPPVVETEFGRAALTHWNLNDGTLEGLKLLEEPAFSVQYHPEAAPGPHDAAYLFDRFVELMETA